MPGAPRRVMYVNHVAEVSGAEGSLLALVSKLDRRRFEPVAAVPVGPLSRELEEQGVQVGSVPGYRARRPRGLLQMIGAGVRLRILAGHIRRVGEELECDLVHANSLLAALASIMACGGVRPVIWHARDLRAPRRAERWVIARATRIVAISTAVVDHLLEVGPAAREKTTLVHNGIDPESFRPTRPREQVRAELGAEPGTLLVGTVGQLVPWKRQDRFIRMAAAVPRTVPNARFVVVGADLFGEHPDYVQSLHDLAAELGVAGRIVFTGYREDMPNVMSALDLLVHTAEEEPLGRVLLEAMCLGVPCVAPDSGGPAEIIEDGVSGALAAEDDGEGFAREAGALLLDDERRRAMSKAAIERIRGEFSALRMAQLTEEVYEEALAEWALSSRGV